MPLAEAGPACHWQRPACHGRPRPFKGTLRELSPAAREGAAFPRRGPRSSETVTPLWRCGPPNAPIVIVAVGGPVPGAFGMASLGRGSQAAPCHYTAHTMPPVPAAWARAARSLRRPGLFRPHLASARAHSFAAQAGRLPVPRLGGSLIADATAGAAMTPGPVLRESECSSLGVL